MLEKKYSVCTEKIPENSRNFIWKCLSPKDVFHLTHSSGRFPFTKRFLKIPETSLGNAYRRKTCSIWHARPIHPRLPSPSDVFAAKIQNGGTTVIVKRMLDFSLEDEGLFNSDDDDIPILAAVATYMRRHLPRNKGFYENILLAYKLTIDEFKSHFRMTQGTFDTLCREVQAPGRVPKFLNQEPGHDRLSIRRKRRRRKPPS